MVPASRQLKASQGRVIDSYNSYVADPVEALFPVPWPISVLTCSCRWRVSACADSLPPQVMGFSSSGFSGMPGEVAYLCSRQA